MSLEDCKYEVYITRKIRIDYGYEKSASDESDNVLGIDGDGNEFTIDNKSDNNESDNNELDESENNESKKPSKQSKKASKKSD